MRNAGDVLTEEVKSKDCWKGGEFPDKNEDGSIGDQGRLRRKNAQEKRGRTTFVCTAATEAGLFC